MSGYLYDALLRVPSVESFLGYLFADLAERQRNLIVLLPLGIGPVRVWNRLRANLWQREFTFEEIHLPSSPKSLEPIAVIIKATGASWSDDKTVRSIPNLFRCPNLPDIIYLEGIDQLDEKGLKAWFDFLQNWSINCQQRKNSGGSYPLICAMLEGDSPLPFVPNSEYCLAVHWWWGFPSLLESHLLCRIGGEAENWDSAAIWREYLLPSLAGNDISLIEELWDDFDTSLPKINQLLLSFAEKRGWSLGKIQSCEGHLLKQQNGNLHIQQHSPPKRFQRLWANGILSYSLEHGIELHPAALAVLGDSDSLKHRIWRGQTEIVMPMLDSYRLEICRRITNVFGQDWPTRWDQPKNYEDQVAVRENPLAVSWGYLKHLLDNYNQLSRFQYLIPLVSLGHFIRNQIAHYKPILYQDFDSLLVEALCLVDR